MTLWRISRHLDLSGRGGLRASGRWHWRGRRVVYFSDHPSTCLLEMLVQVGSLDALPPAYTWIEAGADGLDVADIGPLPDDWHARVAETRTLGEVWLRAATTPLLRVPAVVAPLATNYLLNPRHPAAAFCEIRRVIEYPVDTRLAGAPA